MSRLEERFALQLLARKYPPHEREHRFHPTRRWRFDFAWPELKVAVEVEGGTFAGGRHTRGKGFQQDCQKYNSAAVLGWFVLRGDEPMVRTGELADALGELLP